MRRNWTSSNAGLGRAGPAKCTTLRADEVACGDCGLDVLCLPLGYGEPGSGLPEGILLRRQPVARGESIFHAGDRFGSFFAIKSGSFKAQQSDRPGDSRVVGFFLPGELIGVEGMAGGRYSYTARALEPSSVCELRVDRLGDTGRPLELLQQGVIRLMGEQVAFQQTLIECLVRQNAEQRVAGFLLDIARRRHDHGMPATEFSLPMSRTDIASYLGLAGETVSRLLARLQKTGTITIRRKRVALRRPDRLDALAKNRTLAY